MSAIQITLNNSINLTGNIRSIDNDYLYLENGDILFIIDRDIIATVDGDDAKPILSELSGKRYHRINFNSFTNTIEIDHRNQYKTKLYTEVRKYFPDINPEEPLFEPPPNPALTIHNYVAFKPMRLIFCKWTDVSYSRRFIKPQLEWRISVAHLPEFEAGALSSLLIMGTSDLYSMTTSLRRYLKPSCSGFFGGIGYSTAKVTVNEASILFDLVKTGADIRYYLNGAIFEVGLTGTMGKHGILNSTLALYVAKSYFEFLDEKVKSDKLMYVPSVNVSIGFGF